MSYSRAAMATLIACALTAPAMATVTVTVSFKEGGGAGHLALGWDGTDINPSTDLVGFYDQFYLRCSLDAGSDSHFALLAIRDILGELPTSGADIVSATLMVYGYWGENDTVNVYRVLTDWLPDTAGQNEYDVTGQHAELSSASPWATGAFSTDDYDSANGASAAFTWAYLEPLEIDVTGIVADMVDAGDSYGFALTADPATAVYIHNCSDPDADYRPVLEIVYSESGDYTLTVNSGTGCGIYPAGTEVPITASLAPAGLGFAEWIGDTENIESVHSPSTTITMLGGDAEVTATYATGQQLSVVAGSGDGTYCQGVIVPISADPPASNQVFSYWTGDTQYVASTFSADTTLTMPASDAAVTAIYRDYWASIRTIYQNLEEATSRIDRLYDKPYQDLIDANGFFQNERLIFHDTETGKEIWSLTREKCKDLANIERRCAWSCNGQYISFISNKNFWDRRTGSMWTGTWAGYSHIANADSSKRRKLWAVGPSGIASFQDKFNNWDADVPNRLYYAMDNKIWRVTLGPGNNDTDNVAEAVWTFGNSTSRIIQEVHDDNWLLVEESGSSPSCHLFNLSKDPSDPHFCLSYPLAGEVHPGSFRFRRSQWVCTGGYEYISGGITLFFNETSCWPGTLNTHLTSGVSPAHLWYGPPDDRRGFFGSYSGKSGLYLQHPGQWPVLMADVPDGHVTWCSQDPEWFFGAVGPGGTGDMEYYRRLLACNQDGSTVEIICRPWDRMRLGDYGYDGIPRPNQSPDATKSWFHSSMLNGYDSDTGSYIAVFRKPYAPTAISYSGGQLSFTPHTLSNEVKSYLVYRNDGDGWTFEQEVPAGQTSCTPSGSGIYMITSCEWSGLESDVSSPTVTVPGGAVSSTVSGWDTTPPDRPTGLAVVKEAAGRYKISWDPSSEQDLRYYNIYCSTTDNPAISQQRRLVSPPGCYSEYVDWCTSLYSDSYYAVTAVDRQGNESLPAYLGGASYTLTVANGSGSGDYDEAEIVAISADPAPSGKAFAIWIGDTGSLADHTQAGTNVTMPAADVSVTAAYAWVYHLTVNSGSGDGQYLPATVVEIQASPAPSAYQFDAWTGDLSYVSDIYSAGTTVTMPSGDCEVTATYQPILVGDLDGSGYVGQGDLDILLDGWGNSPPIDPRSDPSEDGWVGQPDLDIVLDHWGESL